VDQILADPEVTSVRLVTNPEKIVLKETQRAFMYFCLYKMNIDAVIMNRLLPQDVTDDYFRAWRENQKHYLEQAELYFDPVPIFKVPLFEGEVLGLERLGRLAAQVYQERNPLEHFFKEDPYQLVKLAGEYRLSIKLPFIVKEDVDLNKVGDELIVKVGTLKRHILLPRSVAAIQKIKAKREGSYLHIYFKGEKHGDQEE
jgi:arsenite-transporting ATPase